MDSLKKDKEVAKGTSEPKIVAEFKINPPLNATEQFLEDYHNCCLCGSELMFTHVTDFILLDVKEEAYCMTCNVRTKQQTHRLQ